MMNIKFDTKKFLILLLMQAPTIMDAQFRRPTLYVNQKIAKDFSFNDFVKPLAAIHMQHDPSKTLEFHDTPTTFYIVDAFSSIALNIAHSLLSTGISLYGAYKTIQHCNRMPFLIAPIALGAIGIFNAQKTCSYIRNASDIKKHFPCRLTEHTIRTLHLSRIFTWRYRCANEQLKPVGPIDHADHITLPTYWIAAGNDISISNSSCDMALIDELASTAAYNYSNYKNAVRQYNKYQIIRVSFNKITLDVPVPYSVKKRPYIYPEDILYAVQLHDKLPIKEAQRDTVQLAIDKNFSVRKTSFGDMCAMNLKPSKTVVPISISSSMNSA